MQSMTTRQKCQCGGKKIVDTASSRLFFDFNQQGQAINSAHFMLLFY